MPIELAVIDLDNTLYAADSGVFSRMDQRMTAFIARELHLSEIDADALRVQYWRTYGTTLRGLMLHHAVEPELFLHDVHDIDAHELLVENEALNRKLRQLPMRKVIHTNGTREHAERILDALGVRHHFSEIYDIRFNDYIPKPCKSTLKRLLDREGAAPADTVVVDDMEDNLQVAQELGTRTCWVSSEKRAHRWDGQVENFESVACLS